jgi:hypothetical protein
MRNRLVLLAYLIFIFLIALYAFKRPYYNWDMLPYMAVVIGYDHKDPNFVHDTVYEIVKKQLPALTYNQLMDGGLEFRKSVAKNSNEFYAQMPFYSVKPLYTGMLYFFYKAGVPLIQATILPSFIAYVLIGFLLIFWIKRYMQFYLALTISSFTMLSAPMWDIVRNSSPDCLSAFLLLSAMYFILERKSLVLAFLFLLLSIFARLDNLIPSIFFISLLTFSNNSVYKVSAKKYLLMILFISLCYLGITFTNHQPGWNILYYPTFLKSLNLTYSHPSEIHLNDYLALSISHIMTGLFFSHLLLFLVLALLTLVGKPPLQFRKLSFDQLFLCTIIAIMIVRFVLDPVIADRFYVAYYLCILILLIRTPQRKIDISGTV